MTNLLKLPTWADKRHIFAVVETPRGSTCKLDFDPELRAFTLAKPLMAGLAYPYDWGFIPSTTAEDGDPLDVLVIHDFQTYPGVVLRCKPVGILEFEQKKKGKKERNDRVFSVPDRSPLETYLEDVRRLPSRAREELERFFRATNALEDKEIKFLGWRGPAHAIKTINRLSRGNSGWPEKGRRQIAWKSPGCSANAQQRTALRSGPYRSLARAA
jgi:inorganic pyrophosphatase